MFRFVETHKLDYLKRFSVGVIGSRMLVELLWRMGIGCIRYVSDFITPNDVILDVSLKPLEANDYDIVHPIGNTNIVSYLYSNEEELKRQLKGVDVVIAHRHIERAAKIAEEIGAPFIPNFVTTFLPDGVSFFDVERPHIEFDPLSYSLTCTLQAWEILKLLTGYEMPIVAPKAMIVDPKCYIRSVELKVND